MNRYKLLKGSLWLVSLLPFWLLYGMSDLCCFFLKRRYRTKTVRQNLQMAFPEKTDKERKEIEERFYHQLCDNFVGTIKMLSMTEKEFKRRMTFSGLDYMNNRFDAGQQFCFLYLSHFGNWEWISSIALHMQENRSSAQIYHHIYNRPVNQLFMHIRSRFGGINIEMKETFKRIIQMKRETDKKFLVGFISDQKPKWNSIHHFVPFLHQETAVFTGAEHIGRKVDAIMMYGRMSRPKRGYYHLDMIPMEDHPATVDENSLTDRYFALLEADIKAHPEMWLWTHKRWSRTKEEWLRRQKQAKK